MRQFQIIFTPVAAAELGKMPKDLQLNILGEFRGLPQQVYQDDESFGRLERDGRILHRYRLGDYRIYFEKHELGVLIHRILSRNTLKDFCFRSKISLIGEDEDLEDNPHFWELIEAGKQHAGNAVPPVIK
ncbi:MAG: hypothetical protein IKX46_02680 [Verrucomicrobia bacterium]|nr:hypothetical protein [Verrucomicrobiota bacterium]MBO4715140.1 hypothetical protein [Verrucomicrobiota bacterium]MBR5690840.1 hypothetical protein [Verrucomicrobiota bacterium]